MAYASNLFVAVYQVLDDVLTCEVAPPGAKATIHAVIDNLRMTASPRDLVAEAERISVHMHNLEWAVARGDLEKAKQTRHALESIASSWLDYCVA